MTHSCRHTASILNNPMCRISCQNCAKVSSPVDPSLLDIICLLSRLTRPKIARNAISMRLYRVSQLCCFPGPGASRSVCIRARFKAAEQQWPGSATLPHLQPQLPSRRSRHFRSPGLLWQCHEVLDVCTGSTEVFGITTLQPGANGHRCIHLVR